MKTIKEMEGGSQKSGARCETNRLAVQNGTKTGGQDEKEWRREAGLPPDTGERRLAGEKWWRTAALRDAGACFAGFVRDWWGREGWRRRAVAGWLLTASFCVVNPAGAWTITNVNIGVDSNSLAWTKVNNNNNTIVGVLNAQAVSNAWFLVQIATLGSNFVTAVLPTNASVPSIAGNTLFVPTNIPPGLVTNYQAGVTLAGAFSGTFAGAATGGGSGLTNLTAGNLAGTMPLAVLPAAVVTNNATGVALTSVTLTNGLYYLGNTNWLYLTNGNWLATNLLTKSAVVVSNGTVMASGAMIAATASWQNAGVNVGPNNSGQLFVGNTGNWGTWDYTGLQLKSTAALKVAGQSSLAGGVAVPVYAQAPTNLAVGFGLMWQSNGSSAFWMSVSNAGGTVTWQMH